MTQPVNRPRLAPSAVALAEFSGHTPAELCRRLRHASILVAAGERAAPEREMVLRRARGHLSGTLRRLDDLIAELGAAPAPLDEQLTEPHLPKRIDPLP